MHRRRDRAQARFVEWKVGLPHAAAAAACTPYLDVSFRGGQGQTRYKCSECGNERTLGSFRFTPCANHVARGVSHISPAQFQKLALGWSRAGSATVKKDTDRRRRLFRELSQEAIARYRRHLKARSQYLRDCKRDQIAPLQYGVWLVGHNGAAAQATS